MAQEDELRRIWRWERRVPLTVPLMLAAQLAAALAWASQLDARVSGIEQKTLTSSGMIEKFARMDERLEHVRVDVGEVRRQLDRLTERLIGK